MYLFMLFLIIGYEDFRLDRHVTASGSKRHAYELYWYTYKILVLKSFIEKSGRLCYSANIQPSYKCIVIYTNLKTFFQVSNDQQVFIVYPD